MNNRVYKPYGENALLIEWEQRIDPDIHAEVLALGSALRTSLAGIEELVPAYCSLLVRFDTKQLSFIRLEQWLVAWQPGHTAPEPQQRLTIPVCYDAALAPDLDEVCRHTGLGAAEVIRLHTGTVYRVYLLGFLPGFPYLGLVPEPLRCPRRDTPRLQVPAGAVGLAGPQTGIYPTEAPGGWQLIGRTPLTIFAPELHPAFLFRTGDEVRFLAVPRAEYEALATPGERTNWGRWRAE